MPLLHKLRIRLRVTSLKTKVILGISLILIVVMGLFTYYDMSTRTRFHLEMQEARAFEISGTVMRSIEYPMLDGEMDDVQAILERLNTLEDVAEVNLCDPAGTIKYSGLPANVGSIDNCEITKEALRASSVVKGWEILGGENILHHAMPISNEKPCYKCHGSEKKKLGVLTVGIGWGRVEDRIAAQRNRGITLALISIVVVGSFLTLFLSKHVTRPLATLTGLSDQVSRGKPSLEFGRVLKCWEAKECDKTNCPAYGNTETVCWYIGGTLCQVQPSARFPQKLDMCRECTVYENNVGDEITRLADSFKHAVYRLRAYEEELRQSEEKYRALFDTEPSPIFILDRETYGILDANARANSQYGYSKEELVKMSFVDLGDEEDGPEIVSTLKGISNSGRVFLPRKQHRRKDGGLIYVNIHVCAARYLGRDALIATTTDITESIKKEAQLAHASKLTTLGEMATGVAHELNQPLTTIQIASDFMLDTAKQGKWVPIDLLIVICEQMTEQVSRAVGIINHLRQFGRKDEVQKEKVDINKPLEGVFTLLGRQLKLRGIKVVLDLKDNLPHIIGDSNRLEQVFIDLVVNARDAMEEKKEKLAGEGVKNTLTVRSFEENGQVVVTISDTGTGIPDEMRDKIFEPFFTTKEAGKGTGLGLSISYGIVKEYEGIIEVESEAGKGSTFKIAFPAYGENQEKV
ncbi:MAG: PAS domain S-box protein [Desulfobacterales bacterium]|nr:PAS domain S-box protein [Desulfobacterales bacterium]